MTIKLDNLLHSLYNYNISRKMTILLTLNPVLTVISTIK